MILYFQNNKNDTSTMILNIYILYCDFKQIY